MEKAGVVAHAQQPRVGKLVKVVVGGKLHRRGGRPTAHMSCNKPGRRRQEWWHTPRQRNLQKGE
jgi:hypothetical protein